MTAKDTNRVKSDNSVSRSAESKSECFEHDARSRRIVEHTHEHGGSTTRRDLLAQTTLTTDELDEYLPRLADGGYIDLIGEAEHEAILLTCRGGSLAGGNR
jgi:hypothetical protein